MENETIPQRIKYNQLPVVAERWSSHHISFLCTVYSPPHPFTWPTLLTNLPAVDFPGCQRGERSSNEELQAVNLYSPCFPYRVRRKDSRSQLPPSSHLCPLLFTSSHPMHPRPCRFSGNLEKVLTLMRRIRSLCWLHVRSEKRNFPPFICKYH